MALLPGSRLFGLLAWSQRQTIFQSHASSSQSVIFSPEIYALQQNTSTEENTTSLTLRVVQEPIRYFQDTANASALSGISTFGGFWTFVNGTFALIFGANIVYFAFGRRPLSALGVVHLFQQRAWFVGGSENAGIVAFMRERLVDLGEDPRDIEQKPRVKKVLPKSGKFRRAFLWRKKIQRSNSRVQCARTSTEESGDSDPIHITASPSIPPSTERHLSASNREDPHPRSHRGYILAETPLSDVDLGLSDIPSQPENIEGTQDIV
ncbi:hypothetical protein C8R45DRAFT_1219117 [Mycena sanguinolenta]|nr:hypothetical protein C8R45DRAFT_1219117 [Mycena sanguinolenta]